jgi:uncharacterized protein (DUF433 family)
MADSTLLDRITRDPDICHGKPTIRNMRYLVTGMLDYLAGGDTIDELLDEFEDLEREDLLACIAYANMLLKVRQESTVFTLS